MILCSLAIKYFMFGTVAQEKSSLFAISSSTLTNVCSGEKVALESEALFISGGYIVDADKRLLKYNSDLSCEVFGKVPKRITQLVDDGGTIYISDRCGNVHRVGERTELVLGSISVITDMVISASFIITSDKDNKIRVTEKEYPNRIDRFILLHTQPITSLALIDNCLISGGYDDYFALYSLSSGRSRTVGIEGLEEVRPCTAVINVTDGSVKIIKIVAAGDRAALLMSGCVRIVRVDAESLSVREEKSIFMDVADMCRFENSFVMITADGRVLREETAEEGSGKPLEVGRVEGYSRGDAGMEVLEKSVGE